MRNYNQELIDNQSQYAYSFDFDVMHPYMIKALSPFFSGKDALELGSYKGDFTLRLTKYFKNITCIEASDEAVIEAKKKLGEYNITFINSLFENAMLENKFNNVFLTHVLEHVDDRIGLLQKIGSCWLTENGRLYIVCPNANAPSRQIAVKMGLISSNHAVTEAEKEHGHRVTYSLDTLEQDIKAAGLNIEYRSGIFFKALANFQWDQVIEQGIVDKKYLDACYELGQVYPDLCSSILFVCRK
jgi:2-polyprenyl-3-methyl-5-hydroxy-6-metoxy-1,4-benzoquinol methylase